MAQLSADTYTFLSDLKLNNDRTWFQANKPRYEAAHEEFLVFVDALIHRISEFDPGIAHHSAKDCVFRIYRDVRFAKDKSPYKTHFGAHVSLAKQKSDIHTRAGYYLHVGPGESMLAGGAYLPQGAWLRNIRQEIDLHGHELQAIVEDPAFVRYFGGISGESLKKVPKDFPSDHPHAELLKRKSFLASHTCSDEQVFSPGFLEHAVAVFKVMAPFDEFLNRAPAE